MKKLFCLIFCVLLLTGTALPCFAMDGYPYYSNSCVHEVEILDILFEDE